MTFAPVDVRVRRFCFCIPVRAGTLFLSLVAATLSAMIGIQATMSLFGLSSVNSALVFARRGVLVRLIWWHLWINCLGSIYYLLMLSFPASKQYKVALWFVLIRRFHVVQEGWAIGVLIELYLVLMIGHYLDELADDEAAAEYGVDIENPEPPYRSADAEEEVELERKRAKAADRAFRREGIGERR
ncbi:hypothetical protein JCM1841_005165 [Sporobolomyces salmonicolor]